MKTNRTFYQSLAPLALATAFLLLIPLVAMQFTDEVVWTLSDFIFAGTLLFGTGLTYKLITWKSEQLAYKIAIGFALFTGLFLIWTNLAVGIIGSEANPINQWYFGVILAGILGGIISRFKSQGMAYTMFAMALALVIITGIVLIGGFYQTPPSTVLHILGVNGFFVGLFCGSGLLFRNAARQHDSPKNTAPS